MRVVSPALLVIGIILSAPRIVGAQVGEDLVSRAIRAYGEVDLDVTVGFLRRWFASDAAGRAPLEQQRRALTYLGAAETLRGNPDSANSAFERLVELDPLARIDALEFPPEVTGRFEMMRTRTKVVSVVVPPVTELRPGGMFVARLFASSPHDIRVALRRPAGATIRTLYSGIIGDSLRATWDGRDTAGAWVPSGSYLLEAYSFTSAGEAQRVLQVPLDITLRAADTLPTPPEPDSLLLPEQRGAGPGMEALFGGLIAGVGIGLLPTLLAPDADLSSWRWAVGGSIGLAGFIGFVRMRPGGTDAARRRANDVVRRQWREQVAEVAEQNRTRRTEAGVTLRAGRPVLIRLSTR